jgi:asparagine synthase (glutamine-hydrolysing)
MCGICGVASSQSKDFVDRDLLERMRDALVHRGPDDAGLFIGTEIGLGVRRLSIIDLETGHQPLANEDQSIWIAFNGEIYNYIELRRDHLEGRFHFTTNSDTEVILRLYERFGEECVHYLNGMFAFAIWDAKKQQLFLARDRLGVKPLYYTLKSGSLIFASEIKSILQHPKVLAEIDPTAIDQFITYGYVQTPDTPFSDIYKLPEGHFLTWHKGTTRIQKYWDLSFQPREDLSEDDHIERIADLLGNSVRLRLRSDVPVGLFLSGGLDSTIVAGLASRWTAKLKTFSIGFDAGREFNELNYARIVAEKFSTDHHELMLSPEEFAEMLPRVINYMEEPVSDWAAIPLYVLSLAAAKEVKVVLSGEGSDELFAGYPIYRYMLAIENYRRIPHAIRSRLLNPVIRALWPSDKMDKYVYLSDLPLERRYLNVALYDPRLKDSLYNRDFRRSLEGFDPVDLLQSRYQTTQQADVLSRLMYLDIKTWLPNDILMKADRMSMAASIELRTPFMDYRLAEYAGTMPSRFKLNLGRTKYILRRAFRPLIPRQILRRGKMGFSVPLAAMFRGPLKQYLQDLISDKPSNDGFYLNRSFVRQLLDAHANGQADHHLTLWRVLILQEWLRTYGEAPVSKNSSQRADVPGKVYASGP